MDQIHWNVFCIRFREYGFSLIDNVYFDNYFHAFHADIFMYKMHHKPMHDYRNTNEPPVTSLVAPETGINVFC